MSIGQAAPFFVLIAIAFGYSVWGLISPRSRWRFFNSWKFTDDDVELTDDLYHVVRVRAGFTVVVLVAVTAVLSWYVAST